MLKMKKFFTIFIILNICLTQSLCLKHTNQMEKNHLIVCFVYFFLKILNNINFYLFLKER